MIRDRVELLRDKSQDIVKLDKEYKLFERGVKEAIYVCGETPH